MTDENHEFTTDSSPGEQPFERTVDDADSSTTPLDGEPSADATIEKDSD